MTTNSFEWPLPQGYRLDGRHLADEHHTACMIAYLDGSNSLCSITAFHPDQPLFTIFSSANESRLSVSIEHVKWVHLLDEAIITNENGSNIPDSGWEQASLPFILEFRSGDQMNSETIGQVCSDTGWFLYLPKKTGHAIRYFVPHTAVGRLIVNQVCISSEQVATSIKGKKNPKMAAILHKMPEKYPYALEQKFARILNKIVELWDTPEIDDYFGELMVAKRGKEQQGFPPDIAKEIMDLSKIHDLLKQQAPQGGGDPWEEVQAKQKLSDQGISFVPKQFMTSLERGDQATSILFINSGINVNYVGENGWTPLMIASFNGNENIARLLIEKGADIHAQDNAGYSPLHWAAFNGFQEVTAILLREGVNPNITNRYGWTPLMQAAARGHSEVVRILLGKSALVNQSDEEGWTPLHKATANGHIAVVKLLLDAGADFNAVHRSGATPLSLAVEKKRGEILQMFYSLGAAR
ncbi:MAG: hypothetical protein AUK53_06715 [Betaproteobacteria bacterium CG2_30_59_46]|nr:MAG: hypothetical protein AUK53_06715 [Betaproteobacteria bacterium CG2_30_59_46]